MVSITVNGRQLQAQSAPDTPLLYVLRNELDVTSPQFGCGLAQCGACSVLLDGKEVRSCVTPLSMAAGKEVTTVEGLPARWAKQKNLPAGENLLHPVQTAWIEEQVNQCGYCINGWILTAVELLEHTPKPTDAQIKDALNGLICRCGTHEAVLRAVKRAAEMA